MKPKCRKCESGANEMEAVPRKRRAGCDKQLPVHDFDKRSQGRLRAPRNNCEEKPKGKMKTRKRCENEFLLDVFDRKEMNKGWYGACRACAHPAREKCGTRRTTRCPYYLRAKDHAKLCDKCEKKE